MKSASVRSQEAFAEDGARCSCGAAGKPFMTLDGRTGYVCERCFVRELLVATRSGR